MLKQAIGQVEGRSPTEAVCLSSGKYCCSPSTRRASRGRNSGTSGLSVERPILLFSLYYDSCCLSKQKAGKDSAGGQGGRDGLDLPLLVATPSTPCFAPLYYETRLPKH
ncbi:unnamed protein product [Linum trigynum]|uniref:Uncharacterized protein n=1 Tax=Linum trigynum TaxID=586398 RepID=A0AAV2EBB8_9ROSI